MKSIIYLIAGLLCIFVIIAFLITKTDISTMVGIIMGGLTLVLIPLILFSMKKIHKRDKKHQDSDKI